MQLLDAENGVIGVRYGVSGKDLPLRVDTTDQGKAQIELVASFAFEIVGLRDSVIWAVAEKWTL